jgi:hypothetical protein
METMLIALRELCEAKICPSRLVTSLLPSNHISSRQFVGLSLCS